MNLRPLATMILICLFSGCSKPTALSVSKTELTFTSYSTGTLTFLAKIRAGDSICWQHGEDGATARSVSDHDREIKVTINHSSDMLEIRFASGGMVESIPIENANLIENPNLVDGKYNVGSYVRKLGVARSPETALYIFVETSKNN